MGWTPLYLEMQDKNVLVVGAGEVGQRRARRFLDSGANVIVSGGHIPPELRELGAIYQPRSELPKWIKWADLVVVASGDPQLNQKVSELAKDKLINRADYPEEGNIIVPSSFSIKDVQFSTDKHIGPGIQETSCSSLANFPCSHHLILFILYLQVEGSPAHG